MKAFILFLISMPALAGYMSQADLESCADDRTFYVQKGVCESAESATCYEIPSDYNCSYSRRVVTKSEAESCADDPACQTALESKTCTDPDESPIMVLDSDPKEVYCTKTHIPHNAGLKSSYDSAKAASDALEAGIKTAMAAQRCGARVKALMVVRNAPKSLNNGQKKQLVQTYQDIIALLDSGSLDTAKAEIQAATADGTLVTEADKTALAAEIDSCKP